MARESWFPKAKKTLDYHEAMVKENPKWRLEDTADELHRSRATVSLQVRLARAAVEDPILQSLGIIEVRKRIESVEFVCPCCKHPNVVHTDWIQCVETLQNELAEYKRMFGKIRLACRDFISEIEEF